MVGKAEILKAQGLLWSPMGQDIVQSPIRSIVWQQSVKTDKQIWTLKDWLQEPCVFLLMRRQCVRSSHRNIQQGFSGLIPIPLTLRSPPTPLPPLVLVLASAPPASKLLSLVQKRVTESLYTHTMIILYSLEFLTKLISHVLSSPFLWHYISFQSSRCHVC